MKTLLSILAAVLVMLCAVSVAVMTWQYYQNRDLSTSNAQLVRELDTTETTLGTLQEEKDQVTAKLASLEQKERELQERLDTLETEAKKAVEIKPRPYRVRAFVGTDSIGDAWIIPHNVTWDEEAERYTFEPVLWMAETAKNHFTVHHTNVVEREVYNTEVYNDYPYYPYYPYYYYVRPDGTNRPPVNPRPPGQPQIPPAGVAQQPDARARLFAPPMSVVNTRPQVIGTPATSPINARVFAP